VKAAGEHFVVQEKRGRKVFSRGVWTSAATVERIRADLAAERSTESFVRRKVADARRRESAQAEYVEDFFGAVVTFLGFHPTHAGLAGRLARAVADHATPVGSGTVARTRRIPFERRAGRSSECGRPQLTVWRPSCGTSFRFGSGTLATVHVL
jgi:hypothetical protein